MGTITARKRSDHSTGYTAQIRLKEAGKVVYSESRTFDRKQAANAWLKKRETELAENGPPGASTVLDPTLAEVIAQYIKEAKRPYGKTKTQVLNTICRSEIGAMNCSKINSAAIIHFAQSLDVKPQTVGNYLSHLAAVFAIAKPAWGYPLDRTAIADSRMVGSKLGLTARSGSRERRPSLEELNRLMTYFQLYERKNSWKPGKPPLCDLIKFAIFSTRRLDEIFRIRWEDFSEQRATVIVRNMKHPGEKIGNDVRVEVPPLALSIILKQRPKKPSGIIFPYNARSVGTAFSRACKVLGIEDLHFHDLRHEGVSWLFELGRTIPQAAAVSGHRSWTSLKRYSHIEQSGDKYREWAWL